MLLDRPVKPDDDNKLSTTNFIVYYDYYIVKFYYSLFLYYINIGWYVKKIF